MIIEFFGLPGSGKTTVYKCLLKSNEDNLCFTRFNADKLYTDRWSLILRFLKPISMINLLQFIYMVIKISGFTDLPDKIHKYSAYWFVYNRDYVQYQNNNDTFILYQQNIFNMILSVLHLHEEVSEKQIQKMVNFFLPHTDNFILVITELDIETVAKRISNRPTSGSRFDSYQDEELIVNLSKLNRNFERLKKIIYKNNIKTIELDMHNSVKENVAIICRYLENQKRNNNVNSL